MIYSDRQIKEMSNYEVDLAVVKKLGIMFNFDKNRILVPTNRYYKEYRPSEDCNIAISIAKKYKISIDFDRRNADFIYITNGHAFAHTKNLERGICEVFLMTDYGSKE